MQINKDKLRLAMARACVNLSGLVAAGIPRGTINGILCKNKSVRPATLGWMETIPQFAGM